MNVPMVILLVILLIAELWVLVFLVRFWLELRNERLGRK